MRKITLTDEYKEQLFLIPLFRDLPLNIKHSLLDRLDISVYEVNKKDIIATQGTLCKKLYVLLEGKLRVDIIDGLGNEVMIEYIVAARAFATPHLFSSDGTLPATFTAIEDGILLTASKESMFKLISEEPKILHNFLCITGNCNVCTVTRLKTLSRKTVRERFVVYLLEHRKKNTTTVNIIHNQATLAEYLNVTRPALSKEINKMIKEGIIEMEGKTVRILDEALLEKYV
ncbi:Crp/Fnr family transcriptional regulator [Bacteroides sp. AM16-24]|jgi:CRP-like cAMP-binding protein|uniref:Crp/Fnr family transcriptional regulator n=1 Tax=Bacteroides sp. AM16-24 TaxID=2292002 RepID=UPI000E46DE56|nr:MULTISPECIES: Crp/Fnr family transcriptional regulator [Bacteroides]RHI09152.1 Crp/Fnr family transcriptional regulator [Bacteroides sp. AM16-24]